jgi:hypothetical protein
MALKVYNDYDEIVKRLATKFGLLRDAVMHVFVRGDPPNAPSAPSSNGNEVERAAAEKEKERAAAAAEKEKAAAAAAAEKEKEKAAAAEKEKERAAAEREKEKAVAEKAAAAEKEKAAARREAEEKRAAAEMIAENVEREAAEKRKREKEAEKAGAMEVEVEEEKRRKPKNGGAAATESTPAKKSRSVVEEFLDDSSVATTDDATGIQEEIRAFAAHMSRLNARVVKELAHVVQELAHATRDLERMNEGVVTFQSRIAKTSTATAAAATTTTTTTTTTDDEDGDDDDSPEIVVPNPLHVIEGDRARVPAFVYPGVCVYVDHVLAKLEAKRREARTRTVNIRSSKVLSEYTYKEITDHIRPRPANDLVPACVLTNVRRLERGRRSKCTFCLKRLETDAFVVVQRCTHAMHIACAAAASAIYDTSGVKSECIGRIHVPKGCADRLTSEEKRSKKVS